MLLPLNDAALQARRQELFAQIAQLGDLRPGSLVQRFKKCGRPACWCAQPNARGHGPEWILTAKVAGKTRTRAIREELLAETRAQIAECQRLRTLVAEVIDVSERVCDARVQSRRRSPSAEQRAEQGQKKPGRRNSPPLPRKNSSAC